MEIKKDLLTWAYLAIVPHPVGLHDALEAWCELVCPQQGGRSVAARDAIDKGGHGGVAFSLGEQGEHRKKFSTTRSPTTKKQNKSHIQTASQNQTFTQSRLKLDGSFVIWTVTNQNLNFFLNGEKPSSGGGFKCHLDRCVSVWTAPNTQISFECLCNIMEQAEAVTGGGWTSLAHQCVERE